MQLGTAKRVTIYIDENDRLHGKNLMSALVERMRHEGISGATAVRAMAGFGRHGQVHTTQILDLSSNLPVILTVIDEPDKVDRVLPILQEMVTEGLIVVEDVQVLKSS